MGARTLPDGACRRCCSFACLLLCLTEKCQWLRLSIWLLVLPYTITDDTGGQVNWGCLLCTCYASICVEEVDNMQQFSGLMA